MDEEKAICLSENVLNRSEIVIKSLFLYYLSHVQKFFKFASINASGIVERYVSDIYFLPITEILYDVK